MEDYRLVRVTHPDTEKSYVIPTSNIAGYADTRQDNSHNATAFVYLKYPVNGILTFKYFGDPDVLL